MKKTAFLLFGCSIVLVFSGCATKKCTIPTCNKPVPVKVKRIRVSECPREVKTVVYKDICDGCNYPVTVRKNNCCTTGGCR